MVHSFYPNKVQVEGESPVSTFATLPENILPGIILVCSVDFSTESLFLAINEATGYSPPLEGIGSKLKGGKQGREAGSLYLYPASEHGTEQKGKVYGGSKQYNCVCTHK